MAKWKYVLDVSDLWEKGKARTISPQELGAGLADRLGELDQDNDLLQIRRELWDLTDESTYDDFDDILEKLYDWADENHKLWLQTFEI